MKTNISVACLFLVFGLAVRAFALAGELKEPGLAFPEGFSESARTNIMASLRRPDCKFLGGQFINSFTSLKYAGDTLALNLFLDGLAKCPGVTLSIRLDADRPDHEEGDWMVGHNAHQPSNLTMYVNLKSSKIKLGQLVIPDIKGPTLSEAK